MENYFSKEKIINNLTTYEACYQISLGKLIHLSKCEDLSFEVDFQLALGSIYELLLDLKNEENLDEIFEEELKKQASMDAIEFFVNEKQDLVMNKKFALEPIINEINENTFFNDTMKEIFEENSKILLPKYEEFISDELANAIMQSLKELENK